MADYNSTYTGVQIDANLALAATAVQDADLGTAAFTASTDYATAAQGALANTAVQPADDAADLGSGAATDGYVLTADGAGGAAWEAAAGGGGTPGGTDTQVQFNDGGAFSGDSGFTFDKTNNTLGLGGGTITASDPIIDMAQTWNNAAVTFTAIKANITSTASAAASLLMDLQVGGVSAFRVAKTGEATLGGLGVERLQFGGGGSAYLHHTAGNMRITTDGNTGFYLLNGGGVSVDGTDARLFRDAANTLAQRNGVNAQAFNLYNTYTDASNYERGFMRFVSNVLQIGAEKLGTGTARALEFQTDGTTRMTIGTTGIATFTGYIKTNGYLDIPAGAVGASAGIYFGTAGSNGSQVQSTGAGVIALGNYGGNDFSRLQFGGATASFPALKRSTTSLQARLANDSAFTNIQGKLTTEANAVAETITATHTITLYDAAGTAYKVPCVAA